MTHRVISFLITEHFMRHIFCINQYKYILLIVITFFTISIQETQAQDKRYLAVSAALFDALQFDEESFEARFEYRLYKPDWVVDPFMGVMANADGAYHIFIGLMYDIPITENFIITPSFAPGYYSSGMSKDLNIGLQFRSQIEVAYLFNNDSRVGISFNHVSNASLGNSNPGTESLAVTYMFPIWKQ